MPPLPPPSLLLLLSTRELLHPSLLSRTHSPVESRRRYGVSFSGALIEGAALAFPRSLAVVSSVEMPQLNSVIRVSSSPSYPSSCFSCRRRRCLSSCLRLLLLLSVCCQLALLTAAEELKPSFTEEPVDSLNVISKSAILKCKVKSALNAWFECTEGEETLSESLLLALLCMHLWTEGSGLSGASQTQYPCH